MNSADALSPTPVAVPGDAQLTMRALVLRDDGLHLDASRPRPVPKRGEALVRVKLAGVCNTDLEVAFKGYKGGFRGVLGHEFVGVVERVEPVSRDDKLAAKFPPGTRVVAEINCVDPLTSQSRTYAERAQDPERTALGILGRDGVFSEWVSVPLINLHVVPDNLSDNNAVLVEPFAAACAITQSVHIKRSDRVAVLGGRGKLGSMACMSLSAAGIEVHAVCRSPARNSLVQNHVQSVLASAGITVLTPEEVLNGTRSGERPKLFDVVIDCTGSADGFNTAVAITANRGTIVLKSTVSEDTPANLSEVVVRELKVVGSRCGPFAVALRMMAQRRVPQIDEVPLLRHFPLDDFEQAFHLAQRGEKKSILSME